MNRPDSMRVANEFIRIADIDKDYVMQASKLHKFVYYANGWHLALYNKRLTEDQPIATDIGPRYIDLWIHTSGFGHNAITETSKNAEGRELSYNEIGLIKEVFDAYKEYTGYELTYKVHVINGPWHKAWLKKKNSTMPDKSMKEYFKGLMK